MSIFYGRQIRQSRAQIARLDRTIEYIEKDHTDILYMVRDLSNVLVSLSTEMAQLLNIVTAQSERIDYLEDRMNTPRNKK